MISPPAPVVAAIIEQAPSVDWATCQRAYGHPGFYGCYVKVGRSCTVALFRWRFGTVTFDRRTIQAVPPRLCAGPPA